MAPAKPIEEAAPKFKTKPSGRKALPSHLPAEEHILRPDACVRCGALTLDIVDELAEEKLHVVKEHQRRRVVRRTTCRCRRCGERTTPRSLPACCRADWMMRGRAGWMMGMTEADRGCALG